MVPRGVVNAETFHNSIHLGMQREKLDGVQDIDPKLKTYLNDYMTWLRDPALGWGLSGWKEILERG
jgi:hypothetical protein